MPANQAHGFLWEDAIKRLVFGIQAKIPYTEKFDIPALYNTLCPTENISIKTAKHKSVDMGDALRIFKNTDVATLITIFYDQLDAKKRLRCIIECKMPSREILFGSITEGELTALDTAIKAVPKGPIADTTLHAIHTMKDELNRKSGAIKLRPKMDSKSQRRLQCSFDDFEGFLAAHPECLLSRNCEARLRGIEIPLEVESTPRQRKAANSELH